MKRDLPLATGAAVGRPARVRRARGLSGAGAAGPASCRGRRPADQATEQHVILAGFVARAQRVRSERAEDRPAPRVDHSNDHLRWARAIEDDPVARAGTICDRDQMSILGQRHTRSLAASLDGPASGSLQSRGAPSPRVHCAGATGAIVNTTATVASTSWAPGWTVVGVDGAAEAFVGPGAATGSTTPDCGSRLIDCTPVTV